MKWSCHGQQPVAGQTRKVGAALAGQHGGAGTQEMWVVFEGAVSAW